MKRAFLTLGVIVVGLLGLVMLAGPGHAQVPEAPSFHLPGIENRALVWIAAQMHILFAAFILGAPIFVVISEWIGMRKRDPRYDRLAKEVTKVTAILYSMTALTGGLFLLFLVGLYPNLTSFLVGHFFPIFAKCGRVVQQ